MYTLKNCRIWIPTFEFDSQLGQGLLHALTFSLPHEAVVDVNCYHLVLVQSFVQEGCADCWVYSTTQQHLRVSSERNSVSEIKLSKDYIWFFTTWPQFSQLRVPTNYLQTCGLYLFRLLVLLVIHTSGVSSVGRLLNIKPKKEKIKPAPGNDPKCCTRCRNTLQQNESIVTDITNYPTHCTV